MAAFFLYALVRFEKTLIPANATGDGARNDIPE